MPTIQSDITIIGAGLTGLCIAYFLRDTNLSINILEARNRLGGRIDTHYIPQQASIDRGATWLGKKHTDLVALLEELKLDIFVQELGNTAIYEAMPNYPPQIVAMPINAEPSYRIKGGSSQLIHRLANQIDASKIHLNQVVQHITDASPNLCVQCEELAVYSPLVISTLPPNLLVSTINIVPVLPENLRKVAEKTHTWMGESIKVGLGYKHPFWQAGKLSGTITSHLGPIIEMYDHSNLEESYYALKGFLNPACYAMSKSERLALVLAQLERYYGKEARNYLHYEETVWRDEAYTYTDYKQPISPHENNGHLMYQKMYLDNRLMIGGSETAQEYAGYMDGAVRSAKAICKQIIKLEKEKPC